MKTNNYHFPIWVDTRDLATAEFIKKNRMPEGLTLFSNNQIRNSGIIVINCPRTITIQKSNPAEKDVQDAFHP